MIRPTFLAFETAKRALSVSQAGLDTVGNNIANVNTPGYTRQRVDQVSIYNSFQQKYQVFGARGQFSGQGAEMNGISQIRDTYLDTRYRNEAATYGDYAIKNGGLSDIEGVLDEISKTGLYDKLSDLMNEISKYAQNADSAELAVVIRNAAKSFCQVMNKNATDLQNVLDQQIFDLDVAVRDEINSTLERVAYLNERIRRDNMYGNPANELNDERNVLLDTLSNYLPIQVVRTPEKISDNHTIERVSIQLTSVGFGEDNIVLVDNDIYNQLGVRTKADGSTAISLVEGRTGFDLIDDISANITSGGIRGFLDVINGQGDFAGNGQNNFRGVPYYQKTLDLFAETFAKLMNDTNSISELDAAGKQNVQVYENKNLFVANMPSSSSLYTEAIIKTITELSNEQPLINSDYKTIMDPTVGTISQVQALYDVFSGLTPPYDANDLQDYAAQLSDAVKKGDTAYKSIIGTVDDLIGSLGEDAFDADLLEEYKDKVKFHNESVHYNRFLNPILTQTGNAAAGTDPDAIHACLSTAFAAAIADSGGIANCHEPVSEAAYALLQSVSVPREVTQTVIKKIAEPQKITAANITISQEWLNEANYFTTTKQDLSVPVPALDDKGNPTYDDLGNQIFKNAANTDNILAFKNLLGQDLSHFKGYNGDGKEFTLFRGHFQEYLVSMQSINGLDKSLNDSLLEAADIVISGYADRRDSISAVNVDEEAINMMTYQNFYNAAARYMNVIDEALGLIIQNMGMVGR